MSATEETNNEGQMASEFFETVDEDHTDAVSETVDSVSEDAEECDADSETKSTVSRISALAAGKSSRRRRNRPGSKASREIIKMQSSVKNVFTSIGVERLVREILLDIAASDFKAELETFRFERKVFAVLQTAAEEELGRIIRACGHILRRRNRVTLMPADLRAVFNIRSALSGMKEETFKD